MDEVARQRYEAKSAQLRAELKQFEADWVARNGGKKPGRQDIKQNPSIGRCLRPDNHLYTHLCRPSPLSRYRL